MAASSYHNRNNLLFLLPLLLVLVLVLHGSCATCAEAGGGVANAVAPELSSRGHWIVDSSSGRRVKLACVNWASHLTPMLAEGLHRKPVAVIAATIARWGFNCVRLTYATAMFTNATLSNSSVSHTFSSLGLHEALSGLRAHNPHLLRLSTLDAFSAVAHELSAHGLLLILDNQISTPGWCCASDDGNGFWGDRFFNPSEWLAALSAVAKRFSGSPHVVAMSLRNELRGRRQSDAAWYRYMQMGAAAIHAANPRLLIIHGGLSYDQNLRFLANRSLSSEARLRLRNKIVYEIHRYSFTNGDSYLHADANRKCAAITAQIESEAGFLRQPGRSFTGPLFVSEFGANEAGTSGNDARFLPCFFSFLADGDLDWAVWALQGSYYVRGGVVDADEMFGLFDHGWDMPRNASFLRRLQALQRPLMPSNGNGGNGGRGDSGSSPRFLLFNAATGLCVHAKIAPARGLFLHDCSAASESTSEPLEHEVSVWNFTPFSSSASGGGYISLAVPPRMEAEDGGEGSIWWISARGDGLPVRLERTIRSRGQLTEEAIAMSMSNVTTWLHNSTESMQFATRFGGALLLCLDGASAPDVITRPCVCSQDLNPNPNGLGIDSTSQGSSAKACLDNPTSQWFQLLPLSTAP